MLIIMICGGDERTGSELRIFANLDRPVTKKSTKAVQRCTVADDNFSFSAGANIDRVLEETIIANTNIGRVNDFRSGPDNRSLSYTGLQIAVFRGHQSNPQQAEKLRWIASQHAREVRPFLQ